MIIIALIVGSYENNQFFGLCKNMVIISISMANRMEAEKDKKNVHVMLSLEVNDIKII